MIGSIRLGNLRARVAKCRRPKKGDIVIRFDRVNHILGNKYMLYDAANFQERTKVISQYKKDLDMDIKLKGPMYKEIEKIANMVINGEHVIGMCWCSPLPCHGNLIIDEVLKIINNKNNSL